MSGFAALWEQAERVAAGGRQVVYAPLDWRKWLATMFPQHVRHPFAERHEEFWEHVWSIELDSSPDPFTGIWPRGGAKSTSAELACPALGLRGKRRYTIYVRATQEQADKSVANIAALLESASVERYYPDHARRSLSKYGASRGWRRNRLRTAGGFTVDAVGLDTAARGLKVEEQRPDFIVLDDIDDKHDSPATTAKKISTITTSILPVGSDNVAVLAIQNLIIRDGFFSRIADQRADYLTDTVLSGPHPAIEGLKTEWQQDHETGTRRAVIVAGEPTWEGQDLDVCQRQINRMGLSAFLKECQHDVLSRAEGVALRFNKERHLETLTAEDAKQLVAEGRPFGGLDFGSWRFGYVLRVPDRAGRVRQIAEYFSQRESLETRARAITAINKHYGVEDQRIVIWGDAANPTDIRELNLAFRRIGSPYRVIAVASENKVRKASVSRINDLMDRNAITYRENVVESVAEILAQEFRRPVIEFMEWKLGYNAGSGGTLMEGSRLLWEVGEWSYPVPKEGEAQDQDPDDDTADGADLIAADRYGIMSWWKAAEQKQRPEDYDEDRHPGINYRTGKPLGSGRSRVSISEMTEKWQRERRGQELMRDGHYRAPRTRFRSPRRNATGFDDGF